MVEKGRNHQMRIDLNHANHLSFGENGGLGNSSRVSRGSTNGLGKEEVKISIKKPIIS